MYFERIELTIKFSHDIDDDINNDFDAILKKNDYESKNEFDYNARQKNIFRQIEIYDVNHSMKISSYQKFESNFENNDEIFDENEFENQNDLNFEIEYDDDLKYDETILFANKFVNETENE